MNDPRLIDASLADVRAAMAAEAELLYVRLAARMDEGRPRFEAPDPTALMDAQAVAAALCISVREVRRAVREGAMPPPVRIGRRRIRWRRVDLMKWMEQGGTAT